MGQVRQESGGRAEGEVQVDRAGWAMAVVLVFGAGHTSKLAQ
jgi:hypothetical protein